MGTSIILQIVIFICVGSKFSKADEENLQATLSSLAVTSDIKYRYATTRVSAIYTNSFNSPVPANFHVTLPARAYISNFSMTVDGNVTYGVVKRKEEAKAIHEEAISKGQSTGYVAVKHRFTNVYDISVNVEAGKEVVFNLTYQELLQRSLGKYRHVIHLINKEIINNFLIEVFISEPQDIIDIQVPKIMADELKAPNNDTEESEEATVEYLDSKNVYIRYNPSLEEQRKFGEQGIEGLFKVNYDVDRQNNSNTIYAVDGYFVHFFAPDSVPALSKNILFMLDVSGSMASHKLQQLKQAMATILNSLNPDLDSFLIGYFSSHVNWMNDGVFMPAKRDNIDYAIKEVNELVARGGTNINTALLRSVEKLNSVSSSQEKDILFFLTDGRATSGVVREQSIRKNVREANQGRVSFFMLGFGDDSNLPFLKEVATENRGFSRKIYVAADSQLQIEGLYNEIANILVKDIQIEYLDEQVDPQSLTATNFSSYFKGSEIVATGKLDADYGEEMSVQMTMTNIYGTETVQLKLELINLKSEVEFGNPNSPNLTELSSLSEITRNTWVFLTLKKLMKEERTEENSDKIISLALKYGFVTPLTAMVVTKSDLVGRVQDEDMESSYLKLPGNKMSGRGPPGMPGQHRPALGYHTPIRGGVAFGLSTVPYRGMFTTLRHVVATRIMTTTTTTSPPPPPPPTKIPDMNVTRAINFIPGIILKTHGCNETLCLGNHVSCLTHKKVFLLADSHAYIYIYGSLVRTSTSNCMEALSELVIKKKRKILAKITPTTMTKNQKTFDISNRKEILLNIKKYLKLKVYIKTVDNMKALSVHFTVMQPLPSPAGILQLYMSNVTCQKRGSNYLIFNKTDLYEKVTYSQTVGRQSHCFINSP